MLITSREKDLGGFSVRRILPYATHRMVGPFIFFDHIGPAEFPPGQGMEVRPHPHIHLATVTYLFSGKIHHRDSLGSDQLIEPGAINWMTAGQGIVHSERTPEDLKKNGGRLHGIQCWVALPKEHEKVAPSFKHHSSESLPEFSVEGVSCKLLLGKAFGKISPVAIHSDLFYVDVRMEAGQTLHWKNDPREAAVYIVDGQALVNGEEALACTMVVLKTGEDFTIKAQKPTQLLLLGGSSVGPRHIYWNFVASLPEDIEAAKSDWRKGPGKTQRFGQIPGDDQDFIPLPPGTVRTNPKGTPL